MEEVFRKAYGKVNLGLDVVGRRPDGYHLVRMVMQTVDVSDDIVVRRGSAGSGLTLSCDNPEVPADERNLAWKAAVLVCRKYGIEPSFSISITKRIPAAAGMAGGSTDGAAVILALNELLELNMTEQEMDEIALSLGADVPFCLRQGTYLAEGIGEKLTKLPDLAPCSMVIIKPPFGVSTPWAYKALDEYLETVPENGTVHPDIDLLRKALDRKDVSDIAAHMGNILEAVVTREYPEILDIKKRLIDKGAVKALMSGSGPTVFGIFTDDKAAQEAFLCFEGGRYGKFKVEF